jgi:phage tail protein X
MDRYKNIDTLHSPEGTRYYKNVLFPQIPLSENDIYVITGEGDRLDLLANQFYKDTTLWWIISIANRELNQGSMYLPVGMQIRIPQNISDIISRYNKLNEF